MSRFIYVNCVVNIVSKGNSSGVSVTMSHSWL